MAVAFNPGRIRVDCRVTIIEMDTGLRRYYDK